MTFNYGTTRSQLAFCLLAIALALTGRTAAAAELQDCERLGGGGRIGDSVVIAAQPVNGGEYTGTGGVRLTGLPSFCRIVAIASPHPSSRIIIEIWMPEPSKWNGKFLGLGNGGAAGQLNSAPLANGIRRGFAAAYTDMGSYPAGLPGIGFNFGDGRPEQVRDFALRSTHAMTALSKEVIARFYGKAPARSYFIGCSTGGNQGLTEVQKFPGDYDGVVAGAPAHNRTHLHAHFAGLRQLGNRPGAGIPSPLMATWTQTIIKACAGRDGGAPSDTFLTNPLQCKVSPRQLTCKDDKQTENCLTDSQANALEAVYAGIRNPRTGHLLYFGDVRGAEQELYLVYGEGYFSKNFDLTHWVLPSDQPTSSLDLDQFVTAMDETYARDINAMDADLSAFAEKGGKLIMYHGWADGLISPVDSIDYYQRITARNQPRENFARLFMVPGMGHCSEGPGATNFGQAMDSDFRPDATASDDVLLALDKWVEEGVAPEQLLAGKSKRAFFLPAYATEAPTPEARPICAFPALPSYDGKGDPLKAESFKCQTAKYPEYSRPPSEYLR